jgi:hypothetical protein
MQLPWDDRVDVARLGACFHKTSATYKFYWFLAILEALEEGGERGGERGRLEKRELFARMIGQAWYTVNYFHVSFGKSDKLQEAIEAVKGLEGLEVDAGKREVVEALRETRRRETERVLMHFDANVPHKFLSPWLGSGTRQDVYLRAQHGENYPPYAFSWDQKAVLVQPYWLDYFQRHAGILKAFCLWNLALFLQNRNPNVPDIPSKLMRPERRGSLLKHKREFWDIVLTARAGVACIYTGKRLQLGGYAVEHFVPHQFVAHDQMWNLIPADPAFNSRKSDRLPPLDRYFSGFYGMQREAIDIIRRERPRSPFLEDYLQVFRTLDVTEEQYRDCVEPMVTIAHNNGFLFLAE